MLWFWLCPTSPWWRKRWMLCCSKLPMWRPVPLAQGGSRGGSGHGADFHRSGAWPGAWRTWGMTRMAMTIKKHLAALLACARAKGLQIGWWG